MKIAILICGLPRSYKKTFESFRFAFSDYDFDVYVHAWELTEKSINNLSNSKSIDSNKTSEEELRNLFLAKKVKLEEQIREDIPGILTDSLDPYPNNAVCFHESIKRCFELIENVEDYDVLVLTRPDIFYCEKIKIEKTKKGTILVPYINNLYEKKCILEKERKKNPDSFFDMLYNGLVIGNYEDLKLFASFADDYVPLCKKPEYFLSKRISYIPDRALAIYIKIENRIKIKEFRYKHGIFREKQLQLYSW